MRLLLCLSTLSLSVASRRVCTTPCVWWRIVSTRLTGWVECRNELNPPRTRLRCCPNSHCRSMLNLTFTILFGGTYGCHPRHKSPTQTHSSSAPCSASVNSLSIQPIHCRSQALSCSVARWQVGTRKGRRADQRGGLRLRHGHNGGGGGGSDGLWQWLRYDGADKHVLMVAARRSSAQAQLTGRAALVLARGGGAGRQRAQVERGGLQGHGRQRHTAAAERARVANADAMA